MTKQEFKELTDGKIVLLDGATGSNLFEAGMPRGVSTEMWVTEHPEVVQKLQRAYVAAGSRIVYAPTFSANGLGLEFYGLETKVREMNRRLVEICREGIGTSALVAGDVTTTGKLLAPAGDITYDELVNVYQEQIGALYEAGVDLLVLETMMGLDETMAALDAAAAVCDLPVMCSLSLEADGTARFGGTAEEIAATLEAMGAAAVGVNCSCGPDQLTSVIRVMHENAPSLPIIAKPNAGMPTVTDKGEVIYHMKPEVFAAHMQTLRDAGASILGGCCGTTPEFIRLLREVVK